MHTVRQLATVLTVGVVFAHVVSATLVRHLSFEQLTDGSEVVVSGRVTHSWAAWDPEHKYIWTHYSLNVASVLKGTAGSEIEFSEPGGAIDKKSMVIAGSVSYAPGDNVLIFLARMANGYLRTAGWTQGKYSVDATGHLHAAALLREETVNSADRYSGSSVLALEGMSLPELRQLILTRARAMRMRAPAGKPQ